MKIAIFVFGVISASTFGFLFATVGFDSPAAAGEATASAKGNSVAEHNDADEENTPPATLATVALCAKNEPGEVLSYVGRVYDYQEKPLAKASVVAYNTGKDGLYVPKTSKTRVPRLRGVAVTDDCGWFKFSTIMPGAYPGGEIPAHIHVVVTAPAHKVQYYEIWFEGDPLITDKLRKQAQGSKETMIVKPTRDATGNLSFRQDWRLEGN